METKIELLLKGVNTWLSTEDDSQILRLIEKLKTKFNVGYSINLGKPSIYIYRMTDSTIDSKIARFHFDKDGVSLEFGNGLPRDRKLLIDVIKFVRDEQNG